jgi:hypothetical protein
MMGGAGHVCGGTGDDGAVTAEGSDEAGSDGFGSGLAGVPRGPLGRVSRVLRPRGRAVLNIGERVPDGTTTHRILGEIWVWSEADARRMVEQAGFIDLSGH